MFVSVRVSPSIGGHHGLSVKNATGYNDLAFPAWSEPTFQVGGDYVFSLRVVPLLTSILSPGTASIK